MAKIKRFNVLRLAKFQALMMALVGLFLGILYSFGGLLIDTLVTLGWVNSTQTPGLSVGTLLAFGALIGMPLIGALIGFFVGIISAILFNLLSRWFGAIETNFKQ